MKRALVTGGAGFIGSNLADRLLAEEFEVVVYDNLSTGRQNFLSNCTQHPKFTLVEGDVLDRKKLSTAMNGCDVVFHFAANADVQHGLEHPTRDLEQNTIATSNVLEAMREHGTSKIVFSSTGSVYGEPDVFPTPESCPFPVQTSMYAASKVAGEGLIAAYCNGYEFSAIVFRLVSILGERYTHGHVYDFYKKLQSNPTHLTVLGDGKQEKSYLYIQDCLDGMVAALSTLGSPGIEIYNLGTDETLVVDESVSIICEHMNVNPKITHTGGKRGWIGDSPLIILDCDKLRSLGWKPKVSISDSIKATLNWFAQNSWVFDVEKKQ